MPPDAFKELLAKLEVAGPINSKDFLKILLGNDTSSLNLKDEIKRTVLTKVKEIVGSTFIIKDAAENSVEQIKTATDNIKKAAKQYGVDLKRIQTNVPTVEVKLPSSPSAQEEPKLYKTKPDEINLGDDTIQKLAKIVGLSNKESNSLLKGIKKSVDDENEHLSGLDKYLSSKTGGLLETLFSFGSLLFKGGLALLAGSTFGPIITKTIDNIFGTNLTGLFSPFKESLAKWQGWIDGFGKWSTLLGLKLMGAATSLTSKLAGGIFGSKAAKAVKASTTIASKVGGGVASLAAKAVTAVTAKKLLPAAGVPVRTLPMRDARGRFVKAAKPLPLRDARGRFVKAAANTVTKAAPSLPKVMGSAAKGAVKLGGNLLGTIGKRLLTKIPGIGLLISAGIGIKKLIDGDIVGGLLDITSGIVGLIPFAGIPLSIAIDLLSANITEKAEGDPKRKGAVVGNMFGSLMTWIKNKIFAIPGVNTITAIGSSIMNGDWKSFLDNVSFLIPSFGFLSNLFDDVKAGITPKDKPLTFSNFFSNIEKILMETVLKMLPESILGVSVRARAAKLLGVEGFGDPTDGKTPPVKEPAKDQQEQKHWWSWGGNKNKSSISVLPPADAAAITALSASINSYEQGINADNVPQTQPVFQDPGLRLTQDLQSHLNSMKEVMFSMSNNFKDLNQNLSSQGSGSLVNISNSSSSQSSDSYISGSRDPIFDARSDWWNITNKRGSL
jgi:hypothetical protein